MLHLMKYHLIVKVRNFNMMFWPLVFPLVLATLFYFSFGGIEEADFETVPAAVVREESADEAFLTFLEEIEKDGDHLIQTKEMSGTEAKKALEIKQVSGIFFIGDTPSLMVGKNGVSESILQSVLASYENGRQTLKTVARKHPEKLSEAIRQMKEYEELVKQVSLGGKTTDGNVQLFYALVAMTCMYGAFIGFGAAITLQANIRALAARRCVTPTHKLTLIISEMVASFLLHFINVTILLIYLKYILQLDFCGQTAKMLLVSFVGSMIGVCMGIFIGSFGKIGEGMKIGILLAISMLCSCLAGLMNGNMKDIVEQHAPILNRINPAALISDAFYCINVYDDPSRYTRNLVSLSLMCVLLILLSFYAVRKERYDSI